MDRVTGTTGGVGAGVEHGSFGEDGDGGKARARLRHRPQAAERELGNLRDLLEIALEVEPSRRELGRVDLASHPGGLIHERASRPHEPDGLELAHGVPRLVLKRRDDVEVRRGDDLESPGRGEVDERDVHRSPEAWGSGRCCRSRPRTGARKRCGPRDCARWCGAPRGGYRSCLESVAQPGVPAPKFWRA